MSITSKSKDRPRVQKFFIKPSLAHQSEKDSCDINVILKKYKKTGLLPEQLHPSKGSPKYGDFINTLDYQETMNQVVAAREAFDDLPAHIRKRFSNDPHEFLDFVHNSENQDEMIRLGLATRRDTPDLEQASAPQKAGKPAKNLPPVAEKNSSADADE